MTILALIAAFVLGVLLSIRMIAALYLILDLWHRIGMDYPRVIRSVVGWAFAIGLIAWLLEARTRGAFASGLVAFLLFYLSLFQLRHVLIAALRDASDDGTRRTQARE